MRTAENTLGQSKLSSLSDRATLQKGHANMIQNAAKDNQYFGIAVDPHRIGTEDCAVDSYQNLLFSILRFHVMTRRFPARIVIISHDFKKHRFLELHAPAIRWPARTLTFIGVDPPEHVVKREALEAGESARGYKAFQGDPYGTGTLLQAKRQGRGWKNEYQSFWNASTGDGVTDLLSWSGGESGSEMFPGQLPWAAAVR
ncbi:MAG: hypothetical protein Q9195_000266 [Heterodermia aff. obscurata]